MREEMSEARPAKYSWVARMQMYCVCTVPCCTYVHTSKKLESVESRLVINLDFPPIFFYVNAKTAKFALLVHTQQLTLSLPPIMFNNCLNLNIVYSQQKRSRFLSFTQFCREILSLRFPHFFRRD